MAKDYNDQDVKFVQMMIPHHQSAVDAAAVVYHKGQNQEIKNMAHKIWNAQKAEIETLRKWLKARGVAEDKPRMAM